MKISENEMISDCDGQFDSVAREAHQLPVDIEIIADFLEIFMTKL